MDRLRFAVIGCGGRGTGVAEVIKGLKNAQLVAVCDVVSDRARGAGERTGVPWFTSAQEMYQQVPIDAIFIATSVEQHYPLAKEAMEHGKHVILEKMMARTAKEAWCLARLAEQRGICGAVCYQLRFMPTYRKWWEIGQSLQPVLIVSSRHPGIMPPNYLRPEPWAGVVDFLTHDLDLVYWMASREPLSVSALGHRGTVVPGEIWDSLTILLNFGAQTGLVYGAMAGWGIPSVHAVIGRKGNVRIVSDGVEMNQIVLTGDGRYERVVEPITTEPIPGDTTDLLVEHFSGWVQGEREAFPLSTFEDGFRVMIIHDAILESLSSGQAVLMETVKDRLMSQP